MSFQRTGKLLTAEQIRGGRLVGQVVPLVNNRLDKFSPYLEQSISDAGLLSTELLDLLVYAVDGSNIPSGSPIITTSITASSIQNGFVNIPVEAALPAKVAVILRLSNGNINNYISWRYVDGVDSSDEPVLVSEDGGSSWSTRSTRKLSYVAYSHISGAINFDDSTNFGYLPPDEPPDRTSDQSATIQAAKVKDIIDDTETEFELLDLDRAVTDGDTVVISFGDFVVTLVVDNSGSMTWNDNKGLRFDFLKTYIQDLDNILPPTSDLKFNILKFNSRRVGKINITLQEDVESKNALDGIRVVRKAGLLPVTGPTDGVVIYEGLGEEFLDENLSAGTEYQYGVFSYNKLGTFSISRTAFATPISQPDFPMGVSDFNVEENVVLNGTYDIGKRTITISWLHPTTDDADFGYDRIILLRRTDRFPENETDGTLLFDLEDIDVGYNGPYIDFNDVGPVTDQSLYAVAGQTYYYAMFTKNSAGTTCLAPNSRRASVKISECDRFWEKLEPPANNPLLYGFDPTAPSMPTGVTVQSADKELRVSWTPGSLTSRRYQIYFQPDASPQLIQDGNGRVSISGELIYDGDESEFVHRRLENDEPNFYAIIAYNSVATYSSVVLFEGIAKIIDNPVHPAIPLNVSAEPYNSTSNRVLWKITQEEVTEVEGYFGDQVRVQTTVSFADQLPFINVGTLEIEELGRIAVNYVTGGDTVEVSLDPRSNTISFIAPESATDLAINDLVSPRVAMAFASETSSETNTVSAIFSSNPLINIQNRLASVEIRARGSLSVRNRASNELITGIRTGPISILLKNPFELGFQSTQNVNRRVWSLTCDNETKPNVEEVQFPGVYVQTGQSFNADLTASFKGEPLPGDLNVSLRVLDIDTNQPSKKIVLPNSSQDGVVVVTLSGMQEELVDRTGQPTGIFETVTRFQLTLPPQDVPGDYILEATASYKGYSRIVRYRINFEASLNIDVDAVPFFADGTSSSEQSAFVYLGDPSAVPENKQPVADDVVVTWALIPLDEISAANASKRPIYSRDNVSGTGIRSKTLNGTAKKIFFGPATDIGIVSDDPDLQQEAEESRALTSCITEGEIYAISATASYRGMTITSYGIVELNSFELLEEDQLNRIFLRRSDTSDFNTDTIYADGIEESAWEVLASPASDGDINDYTSGAFFNNAITLLGGQVPILEEGDLVYINAKIYDGSTEGQKVMIRTNLTGTKGLAYNASAMVEGGKALFYVRLNTVVSGKVKEPPLSGEQGSNIIYGDPQFISPPASPLIIGLSVRTAVRVNGKTVGFYGGGVNLQGSTPPAFVSFTEPLGLEGTE